jgi:hypothetical protein
MMKDKLIYVELKTGYEDNGPAWIGMASYSKSGRTIYFNGRAFRRSNGVGANYIDIENGDAYWISGIKKNQKDRHWAGSEKVMVDESILKEYLAFVGAERLATSHYSVVKLDNSDIRSLVYDKENAKMDL